MLRVRFAPSQTGFLHIGSARTFIFNWLYARRNGGAMILRIGDTGVERNTGQSLQSICEGLNWLHLSWDEQYRQSERLAHEESGRSRAAGPWPCHAVMRELSALFDAIGRGRAISRLRAV